MDFQNENIVEMPPEENEDLEEVTVQEEAPEAKPTRRERRRGAGRPAFTLTVQSWATPIVGLVMLVIGFAGGFYGRPLISSPAAADTPTAQPPQAGGDPGTTNPQTNPASQDNREAFQTEIVSRVRHFRGDPNAPITFIEFSDFQ